MLSIFPDYINIEFRYLKSLIWWISADEPSYQNNNNKNKLAYSYQRDNSTKILKVYVVFTYIVITKHVLHNKSTNINFILFYHTFVLISK